MGSYIVEESPGMIRRLAREALRNCWMEAIGATLLFLVLAEALPSLFANYIRIADIAFVTPGGVVHDSMIAEVYSFLMPGIMLFGFTEFFLAAFRLRDVKVERVFDGFDNFGKAFLLMTVQKFFVLLWTLCFIIPGIVAAYRYSMAFYILVDDPSKGVMECIRESKERMKGNKLRLFFLHLTYVGWIVLASVPVGVLSSLAGIRPGGPYIESNVFLAILINLAGVIPIAAAFCYVQMGVTCFYEIQTGHLVSREAPSAYLPEDPNGVR